MSLLTIDHGGGEVGGGGGATEGDVHVRLVRVLLRAADAALAQLGSWVWVRARVRGKVRVWVRVKVKVRVEG